MEHFDWLKGFVFPYINLFIYLALLYFFGRPAINKLLATKRDTFLKQIQEAQKAKLLAEEQAKVLAVKLASLEKEINTIVTNAKSSAELEAELIIKNAEQLAEHIRTEAKRMAQAEVTSAKESLQKDIIAQVTDAVAKRMSTDVSSEQHLALILKNVDVLSRTNVRSIN